MSNLNQVENFSYLEERLRRSKPVTEPLPQQVKKNIWNQTVNKMIQPRPSLLRRLAPQLAMAGLVVLLLLFLAGILPTGSAISDYILRVGPFNITTDPSAAEQAISSPPADVVTPNVLTAGLSDAAGVVEFPIFYPRYWPENYAPQEPPLIDMLADPQGEVSTVESTLFSHDREHILHFSQTIYEPDASARPFDLPIGDGQAEQVIIDLNDGLWLENYVADAGSNQESISSNTLIWQDSIADEHTFLYRLSSEERLPLEEMQRIAESAVSADHGPSRILNLAFGDALTLLGFEVTGPRSELRLFWQLEHGLENSLMAFVHWRDQSGLPVQQVDLPLPSDEWQPGQNQVQVIDIGEPDLPAGQYTLHLGLYDADSGERVVIDNYPEGPVPLTGIEINEIEALLPLSDAGREAMIIAAMETVVSFNQEGVEIPGEEPFFEISADLWADDIAELNPIRIYWHNNNLAIVIVEQDDAQRGLYIGVPISSYMLKADDFSRLRSVDQGLWEFERTRQ